MSENLSPCLRSHHEIVTEFIYVYTVQDCLMCIADCYFCASRLTFSSLLFDGRGVFAFGALHFYGAID